MNKKQIITLSDFEIKEDKKKLDITRKIYIECDCQGIDHIGRIILNRDVDKEDNHSMLFMWVETNANYYCYRGFYPDKDGLNFFTIPFQWAKWKIEEIVRKIKLGLSVIFKNEVYLSLDWEIMDNNIPELADAIKKSVEEINKIKPKEGKNE